MEPLTILGLSYVGKEAVAVVGAFVREIFGPSAKALGEGISGPLKQWADERTQRAQTVVIDAAHMLDSAGVKPQQVPKQILVPLLQSSSLADDSELQERWVALLANAASPGPSNRIIPGFVDILRQLTPVQARILDWMYAMKSEPVTGWIPHWPDVNRKDIENNFGLSGTEYALLITDMERLQLIEPRRDIESTGELIDADAMFQLVVARWNSRVKYDSIGFTSLGIQFIEACTPPHTSK